MKRFYNPLQSAKTIRGLLGVTSDGGARFQSELSAMPVCDRSRAAAQHVERGHSHHFAPQKTVSLFDHLVGECEQLIRHIQAERVRGLKIDDQLEIGRQLDRQLGRLRPLENEAGVYPRTAIGLRHVGW